MEELLKIAYQNFMDTENVSTSGEIRIINKHWESAENAIGKLKDILNAELFYETNEAIREGIADVQEAAFIAGFSYCAKFMTNGKVDFFPSDKGGAA